MAEDSRNNLEYLLEVAASKLREQQERIDELEQKLDEAQILADNYYWCRHRPLQDEDNLELPIPRLQIRLKKINDWHWNWLYTLVYRHTTGEVLKVPMGETDSKGGHKHFSTETIDDVHGGLPFRDGVHIRRDAWHLSLDAYAIIDGKAFKLKPIPD